MKQELLLLKHIMEKAVPQRVDLVKIFKMWVRNFMEEHLLSR